MKSFYLCFCVLFSVLMLFALGGYSSDTIGFAPMLCFMWIFGEGAYYCYVEYKRHARLFKMNRAQRQRGMARVIKSAEVKK